MNTLIRALKLIRIYKFAKRNQGNIKSRQIESILKVSYKEVHLFMKYWEDQQFVRSLPIRGGEVEYQFSENANEKIQNMIRKKIRILLIVGVFIILLIGLLIFI